MDFSPKSVFWDCLYARCCEEMDMYLKPGSFWERIPDGMSHIYYDFALRYEGWRWYHELHFWKHVAEREPRNFSSEKVVFRQVGSECVLMCCRRWKGLSQREKVREAKSIVKKFEESLCASLDEYLRSGKCAYHDVTSKDIDMAIQSKPPTKRVIENKLIEGIKSLGWRWQYYNTGYIMYGNVDAFGRTFNLQVEYSGKYELSCGLEYIEDGYLKLGASYGGLMSLGAGCLDSFGATDLDADVETLMMMLNRLAWLVATSLDDAEKGLKPEFIHHPLPQVPRVQEQPKGAICGYAAKSNETTDEEAEFLVLLKTAGFLNSDAQNPSGMYELIERVVETGNERLLLLDTECVNDGSEYAAILEKLNTVAGETMILDATSFLDREKSVAGVQFAIGGKVYKGKWEQEDDWMSAKFAELLAKAMEHFSGLFVALPAGDQCARILYFKSRETGEKVEKLLERIKAKKARL